MNPDAQEASAHLVRAALGSPRRRKRVSLERESSVPDCTAHAPSYTDEQAVVSRIEWTRTWRERLTLPEPVVN